MIDAFYIVSTVLFILGIKMLGKVETARSGNLVSALGMLLAIGATLSQKNLSFTWIIAGCLVGTAIGFVWAKKVPMTGMPEFVALFNGFGGLASFTVALLEYRSSSTLSNFTASALALTVLIGAVTFTGSMVAYAKLAGKLPGAPTLFPRQHLINAATLAVIVLTSLIWIAKPVGALGVTLITFLSLASLLLGVLAVLPIGGGDMPAVISLLNSFSGLAASFAGFVIGNTVLVVSGCLVGASGLILTIIMCKAMNRSINNVLFSGFGSAATAKSEGDAIVGEMKASSPEDAYYVLEAAQRVVIIPGYGMAVAQAQHAVKEFAALLEKNGAEVSFAIHPVAGRMPGHMNVLLAEADVPYEQLREMDSINPEMPTVDVAIVIGANDVVNPAAAVDETSPIYGMPIINAHEAGTVYALKRGKGAGFSGLENSLFFRDNCRMLYGDAKATIQELSAQFEK